ncbi:CoA ester lyase [Rhodococcus sp. IEGM 1379]|uniref:HpcH/HpaI aldolase/citrate lyase family protein n=1 Tax=Rhodococcus sp. IEGM 1379 TaxID=3047086 RepID=UPI0024B6CFFB|nr:CoA ester lyase [Rhodococcus sp. IEGM 1379]MDI9915647.1 CoA ester lyase [Rhodococcus sp. IEGM 1379]
MRTRPQVRRRTVLVAPASDERKVAKALASAADEVVLDLEDAVAPAAKHDAREAMHRILSALTADRTVSVRINGLATSWVSDDLDACASLGSKLRSIIVPKAETAEQLDEVNTALAGTDIGVQALIETPAGIENATRIARSNPRLESLILGYADLGSALGRSERAGPAMWLSHQDTVLTAARAAGIHAIDGPYLGISDDPPFRQWAQWSCDLGFDGKWVIHPNQIDSAETIFTPSADAVAHAHSVLRAMAEAEARGAGAAQLDGRMLDEAIAVSARRVLTRIGGTS